MPVVISSEMVLHAEITAAMPRILYDDIWRLSTSTISPSSEDDDHPAANVADGLTWDFWKPASLPATLEVNANELVNIDYALLVHTLGSNVCSVSGEYYDGSTWVTLFPEYAPGDDRVLAFLFERVAASRFRLSISGDNSPEQIPAIKIAMMGQALAMQRGITLNHKPITLSRKTEARPQVSEGGALLGRSIRREGVMTEIAFENIEADWLRQHFEPFIESARVYPFGWVWHPENYPAEVAFVWTPSGKEDIRPAHSGLPDRMNVSFPVEGIIE